VRIANGKSGCHVFENAVYTASEESGKSAGLRRAGVRRPPVDPEHAEFLHARKHSPWIEVVDGARTLDDHVGRHVHETVDQVRNAVGHLADDDAARAVAQEDHRPSLIGDLLDHFGDIVDADVEGDVRARRGLRLERC